MKFATLALLALVTVGMSACANTWHGVGEDTENVGEEIQQSSGNSR